MNWRADSAARKLKDWQTYAGFFGIRRKAPVYPAADWAAALERADRIENPDPATLSKRERAQQKRAAREAIAGSAKSQKVQAAYAARRLRQINEEIDERTGRAFYREQAARTNWRMFGALCGAQHIGYAVQTPIMLRLNGDELETSAGAKVPAAAAPMVWRMVNMARANGAFNTQGLGRRAPHIGDYPLDRIDADGTLHAGCHTIPYSELAAMARALGLAS